MARRDASLLNLFTLIRRTGKPIYEAEPLTGGLGIEKISTYLISKGKIVKEYMEMWEEAEKWEDKASEAPTFKGVLGKEAIAFYKTKNCREATEMWKEAAKKWKKESSENWEEVTQKYIEASILVEKSSEDWEEKDMAEEAAIMENHARIAEGDAMRWEEKAKGCGSAIKRARGIAKAWEEAAKHWEDEAKMWQEEAVKWGLEGGRQE